jgi:Uncharacterized conserved protein
MKLRSGTWKTNLSGETSYKSFVPTSLPPNPAIEIDEVMMSLLISANKSISSLNTLSNHVPNATLFIYMYVRKEALISSQIEGTQATIEDIFNPLEIENANRNVEDVINYVQATEYAINRLTELPLCNRLIKEAHQILVGTSRGHEKTPGEFRYSQNWIGGQGSSLATASYIPPNVADMNEAIADLEQYMNLDMDNEALDPLIRVALIHYQFETIHPFLDGNGRIGRLLITLFLLYNDVLSAPTLYISYYLKINRIDYYDRMMMVREQGNYEQWVTFFLKAIIASANDAITTIEALSKLHERNVEILKNIGRMSKNSLILFEYLEKNPIIEIGKTAKILGLSFNTTANVINRLIDLGIIVQIDNGQRNRVFAYQEYLDILKSGTE